jgi:hypothetical protein
MRCLQMLSLPAMLTTSARKDATFKELWHAVSLCGPVRRASGHCSGWTSQKSGPISLCTTLSRATSSFLIRVSALHSCKLSHIKLPVLLSGFNVPV